MAFLGTTSHGQSVETTMAQIVADTLGVGYDDVTVVQADTQSTPYGPGTGGSRTAVIAGGAAREATEAVREKVLQIAAHVMEASPDDLEIENSVVSVRGTPTRNMSLSDIAKVAYVNSDTLPPDLMSGLEATVRFRPSRFPTWSNATHACVVEIDPDTWLPEVKRYIVSEDCGNMINPNVVEGQVAGGVIQGLGGVLLEDFVYDSDGNPLTSTFMDYLLPTASEVPDLEIGHIMSESTTNPGGFKGLGEGGAIGSHAAVANAVADALAHLGVRVTKTPLGPEDIFALVEAARVRTNWRQRPLSRCDAGSGSCPALTRLLHDAEAGRPPCVHGSGRRGRASRESDERRRPGRRHRGAGLQRGGDPRGERHPAARVPLGDVPVPLADHDRRQRLDRRHVALRHPAGAGPPLGPGPASRREGPRARAARRVEHERRAGPRVHGRRPLDRPRRAAPARRAARLGPQ